MRSTIDEPLADGTAFQILVEFPNGLVARAGVVFAAVTVAANHGAVGVAAGEDFDSVKSLTEWSVICSLHFVKLIVAHACR